MDATLKNAYLAARAYPAPSYALQGATEPLYLGAYVGPHDGMGAAAYALSKARQNIETVAQRETESETAEAELAQLWESLGMAEPKRYSPEGENLAHARNVVRDSKRLLSRARAAVQAPSKPWHGPQSRPGHVYFESPGSVFRDETAAHDVDGGPDHNGWFDNEYGESSRNGEGLFWGMVARLPGRDGKARFVAGWRAGYDCQGATYDLGQIFESASDSSWETEEAKTEAARAADGLAETMAESERGYKMAWRAGSDWAELGEEIAEARRNALALLAERRTLRVTHATSASWPAMCKAIRDSVTGWRADIAEAREKRAELALGFDHRDGWADGAGV